MNEQELTELVETCWRVSRKAALPIPDAEESDVKIARYNTYYYLLQSLLPKTIECCETEKREPWQEG